jgi:1,4-dihydroxy-2-naphthoyl-CoA hydrolase
VITDDPTTYVRTAVPLCDHLGVEVVELGPDRVTLELDWRPELCTAGGVLHGGVLMALADSAAAVLAHTNLPDGARGTTTIDAHTNLLGAVTGGTVRASATAVHAGRTTFVAEVATVDAEGRAVARTVQTQLVLR